MLIGINGGYFPAICRVCLHSKIFKNFKKYLGIFEIYFSFIVMFSISRIKGRPHGLLMHHKWTWLMEPKVLASSCYHFGTSFQK